MSDKENDRKHFRQNDKRDFTAKTQRTQRKSKIFFYVSFALFAPLRFILGIFDLPKSSYSTDLSHNPMYKNLISAKGMPTGARNLDFG
ncbi:MAG: hypothetical protein H8D67_31145 [Deltaproteobacteria bacterium]|nr:hypothetical protein [Deltaproteobacteria bacterium]